MSRNYPDEARARDGLQAWAAFPADFHPRPLVLLSPAVRSAVFSDGQKKIAFIQGAVLASPGVPGHLLKALRGHDGDYVGPPLVLNRATLGEAEFDTDRGPRWLPAWEVWAEGLQEPFRVLDPATRELTWEPPGRDRTVWRGRKAALQTDGRTLSLLMPGSPRGSSAGARSLEAGHAVVILPVRREAGAQRGWQTAIGEHRKITALLARPLGDRVLLDETGSPVMVTPAHPTAPQSPTIPR